MAESTLSLSYGDLKAAAGLFLGFGRGASKGDATWTARQSSILDEQVRSGLRQFYFPEPLDKSGVSYEWSFLRPSTTLALAASATSVELPDDFGGIDGAVYLGTENGDNGLGVEVGSMQMIRQLRAQQPTTSGRPQWVAVEPVKGTTVNEGQRWVLEVFPTSDAAYTLSLAYFIHPDALSGARPYAYGGTAHAETIQMSIIAAAALYMDDQADVRKAAFLSRLAVSISQDRKLKPQQLGYNGDRSNAKYGERWSRRCWTGRVTVYGQAP